MRRLLRKGSDGPGTCRSSGQRDADGAVRPNPCPRRKSLLEGVRGTAKTALGARGFLFGTAILFFSVVHNRAARTGLARGVASRSVLECAALYSNANVLPPHREKILGLDRTGGGEALSTFVYFPRTQPKIGPAPFTRARFVPASSGVRNLVWRGSGHVDLARLSPIWQLRSVSGPWRSCRTRPARRLRRRRYPHPTRQY